ncbi:UDP-glucose dehydrogenase family protein [Pseudaminobacter soli (ex Li et al. 2025)]|uniref:UDP-glucose 6-dehydrogenase n=1 Tax=Pseudaminobacter soli (ex Li et al. 2025) TaxID=1295366 RepID=A0A2P7S199_9HYPH|nr:UDP-glucose/GDP-mannose dehydrogenase family protein [Mesorhizobium soli]PSJ56231.1 UDP-glucose 6-dehydrogenase [Mesorhizobium soli]
MKVVMVGAGYVGLVSSACFAELGHCVVCVDKDTSKVAALLEGKMPIYEPGLEEIVAHNVAAGRLSFAVSVADVAAGTDAFFIAVGTPPRPGDGEADLSHVRAAAAEIGTCVQAGSVVVTKSTVPVGTGDMVEFVIRSVRANNNVEVVSNPEFLREGSAILDFMKPDRIVVGTDSLWARSLMGKLYEPLTAEGATLLNTSRRAAEVIKYAANAFLAAKISFINEMADFCEATGASIDEVSKGMGLDRRIGEAFLNAGPGYGGSCFPKDSMALLATAHSHSVALRLVESTIAVNEARKRAVGRRILNAIGGVGNGKKVAVLGLTFKPNTDDMRESPAISIISSLQSAGASVTAYDPEGMRHARLYLRDVAYAADAYECVEDVDSVVLVTEWDEFLRLDFRRIASVMRQRVFVDLRNAVDVSRLAAAGFAVHRIGHPQAPSILPRSAVRPQAPQSKTLSANGIPQIGLETVRDAFGDSAMRTVKGY